MDDFCSWAEYQSQQEEIARNTPPPPPSFGRLSLLRDRLAHRKPAQWIIDGVIPDKGLTFLHALQKVGKTFIAVDWSVAIASGQDWHGYNIGKQGAVIYVSGEGNEAIDLRFAGCCQERGLPVDNLPIALPDRAYSLPTDKDELIQDVKALAASFADIGVSVVIFDTFRRTLVGDMNSNNDVGAWVKAADEIKATLNCAVVVVHHTLRGGERMGGAQTLEASHDSLFYLTDVGTCDDGVSKRVLLTHQEVKERAKISPAGFILQQVAVGIADQGETTLVVKLDPQGVTYPERKQPNKAGKGGKQQEALQLLADMEVGNRARLAGMDYSPDSAAVKTIDWEKACLDNKLVRYPSEFDKRIFNKLQDAGLIRYDPPYVITTQMPRN